MTPFPHTDPLQPLGGTLGVMPHSDPSQPPGKAPHSDPSSSPGPFLIPHPSSLLPSATVEIIRESAAASERMGELHPDLLALIYREKWFKLFVPARYNGLSYTLLEAVRLEEALSWTDGSMGWTVTLCSGAGWFAGFLQDRLSGELLTDERSCLAGSGAPAGVAVVSGEGYHVSGRWKYASGAPHATAFTANCVLYENGQAKTDPHGAPLIAPFVFRREEVLLHEDWSAVGLKATASRSFEVKDLWVPPERRFRIDPDHPALPAPLYRYPFLQLAETTLAANSSGLALHFLDLCEALFQERAQTKNITAPNNREMLDTLDQAQTGLKGLRQTFYQALDASWQACINASGIPSSGPDPLSLSLPSVSEASYLLARHALRTVDLLYPYCGLAAANPGTEINRVWRDIHTAGQHPLLTFHPRWADKLNS